MKEETNFEKLIKTLKDVKPKLAQPEDFTNQLINKLPEQKLSQRKGINISDNGGRWTIFIGMRTAAAVAAFFLIGFFAFQQWEITTKISRLEEEVNNQKSVPFNNNYLESLKASYFESIMNKQELMSVKSKVNASSNYGSLNLDEMTLTQLLQQYEQLKAENGQLKAAILHQFADTLKRYKAKNIKIKSL